MGACSSHSWRGPPSPLAPTSLNVRSLTTMGLPSASPGPIMPEGPDRSSPCYEEDCCVCEWAGRGSRLVVCICVLLLRVDMRLIYRAVIIPCIQRRVYAICIAECAMFSACQDRGRLLLRGSDADDRQISRNIGSSGSQHGDLENVCSARAYKRVGRHTASLRYSGGASQRKRRSTLDSRCSYGLWRLMCHNGKSRRSDGTVYM